VLDDAPALPESERVLAFAARVDAHLAAIANSLRSNAPPPTERLRGAERELAEHLETARSGDATDAAVAVADAFDRITDSVDTMAHIVRRSAPDKGGPGRKASRA
jgi:hypothetical protein